jgi:hypothetical protein
MGRACQLANLPTSPNSRKKLFQNFNRFLDFSKAIAHLCAMGEPPLLSPSPSLSTATAELHFHFITATQLPYCRSSSGEAGDRFPVLPFLFSTLVGELSCPGTAGGRAPVSALSRPGDVVSTSLPIHGGLCTPSRRSPPVDWVHGILFPKIITYSRFFQRSCKKVPGLLGNHPTVLNFRSQTPGF